VNGRVIRFFVPGIPMPQGSKKAFYNKRLNRVQLVESCSKVKPWRSDVRVEAMAAMGEARMLIGPVALMVQFLFPRPSGQLGSGRNAGKVKPSAPMAPAGRPDLDKLIRSVCDALKGIAWADDSQVCSLWAKKDYAAPGVRPGAIIQVEPLDASVAPHS